MELARPRVAHRLQNLPALREISAEQIDAAGKAIRDSGAREKYGVTIVRVMRSSGEGILNPASATVLQAGDVLHVLGLEEDLEKLQ